MSFSLESLASPGCEIGTKRLSELGLEIDFLPADYPS
jgi:hypothetical protein